MSEKQVYVETPNGNLIEIKNWRQRSSNSDPMLTRSLDEAERSFVEVSRKSGLSDTAIFRKLNPGNGEVSDVELGCRGNLKIQFEDLSKEQLVEVLEAQFGIRVPSATNMVKAELILLLKSVLGRSSLEVKI